MCPMPDDGRDPDERAPLPVDDAGSDDGAALSPDELDIEDDENVVQLDSGRYVIGTDDRPTVPDSAGSEGDRDGAGGDRRASDHSRAAADASGPTDSRAVKEWLESDLEGTSAQYGFHVAAKADGSVSHQQMFSDDVTTVFDGLLRWYAQQLTTETPVADVLGILLTESNVRVRYSPSCLQAILRAYDLGPDDTIADLFEAVEDDRGMVFPPENV